MKTSVYCTFQFELIHCFDNVEQCGFTEVNYLKYAHRHLVKCKVVVPVAHTDRDIEFICLKHYLENFVAENKNKWPARISMEMIGEKLVEAVVSKFGADYTPNYVEVSEDGENGAIIEN